MHIVKTIKEFLDLLKNPNPNVIYGLVPEGFTVLNKKIIEDSFQTTINKVLYGDVKEIYKGYEVIRYNPSFCPDIIQKGFNLNSPIFVRTQIPLTGDRENISELLLQLLSQEIGIHIPKVIFSWNPDLLIETNTQ